MKLIVWIILVGLFCTLLFSIGLPFVIKLPIAVGIFICTYIIQNDLIE